MRCPNVCVLLRWTLIVFAAVQLLGQTAFAQVSAAYVPLREAVTSGTYRTPNYVNLASRAVGREQSYQLFSSVVANKYHHSAGRLGKDEVLVRALRKQRTQRPILVGHYAEDRFIAMNEAAGWRKVKDPFATQRDVWRRVDGRIEYGQIKVHGLGKTAPTMEKLAAVYINSMRKDSGRGQAGQFLVPDDHFDSITRLLEKRHSTATARGNTKEATWLLKQKDRLARLGVSYKTLSNEADLAQRSGRDRIVARYAGPVITVIFLAGSTGYEVYRWSSGQTTGREFALQLGKSGSIVTLGFGTSHLVARSEFLMANPYRAGGIVSAVIFVGQESWLVYEHGGLSNATATPDFFVKSGGNLGAATLGLIGSIEGAKLGAMIGSPGGWTAVVGAGVGGIAGGAIGSTVGYIGGERMTDWMLETLRPEFYYKMKLEELDSAENRLTLRIDRLSGLSVPLATNTGSDD